MKKLCLGLALSLISACGPGYYWEEDPYSETWEVTEVEYPYDHSYGHGSHEEYAHGTLLYRVDVHSFNDAVESRLTLPDGRVSEFHHEAEPCWFVMDMNHTLGKTTQIECVNPLIGPYAFTIKNTHSYPVTIDVSVERNTTSYSSSTDSLYAQSFTLESMETFEIPILFESN